MEKNMTNRTWMFAVAAAAGLVPGAAEAHDLGAGIGLASGLAHPFTGMDHLLAMVAVGLWAAQQGGRALWAVPAAFVAMMGAGAGLAIAGIGLPLVEAQVAGSLLVLGCLVATGLRLPVGVGASIAGAMAVCHGQAHGIELPLAAAPAVYAAGFLVATAALHGVGIGLWRLAGSGRSAALARVGGGAVAATGLMLLAAG